MRGVEVVPLEGQRATDVRALDATLVVFEERSVTRHIQSADPVVA